MNGAREYALLFNSGQYGQLYLHSGSHARGKTFRIWVIPEGLQITEPWHDHRAVEVYGITGGQPGWSETYGWLHYGKWQQEFAELVEKRYAETKRTKEEWHREVEEKEEKERARIAQLLENY